MTTITLTYAMIDETTVVYTRSVIAGTTMDVRVDIQWLKGLLKAKGSIIGGIRVNVYNNAHNIYWIEG